ncbi:hypothetical protein TOPH_06914 [Tolypocladium ophioglossoides CBS 100239]|uniref:Uncharacterized protein n=1 Tax=Tolypocladium ophioglossoides (strain CBS 100239) TaxID=1163406 RepID=A0A0L0N2T4_TOLOC|nr:hypothetical protein TOPH_06914 [Tolypocladium ophioglossoides CBS 100239]
MPATPPATPAIMDSLRGIEGTRPSLDSAKTPGKVRASRDSSISLDGYSAGKAPGSLHASVSVLHQPCQAGHYDSAKSPLLLMQPLELQVMDKSRDPSTEDACPPLPSEPSVSSSSSPILPLEAYLMDKNEHERRLLRLSRCPRVGLGLCVSGPSSGPGPEGTTATSPVLQEGSSVDPPTSSWEHVECDNGEPQGPSSKSHASSLHKRKLEAAEATDLEQGHREKLGRPEPVIETQSASLYIEPESVGAASVSPTSSSSLPDSAAFDILVARPSLAPRHLPLHRELEEAGLGGLGDSSNSLLRYHRAFDPRPSAIRIQKPGRVRRSICRKDS